MSTDIHRLLDEAFVGVASGPQAQDLKEEIRVNLLARVAELEASGVAPADAARRAIDELGDVRELVAGVEATSGGGSGSPEPEGVRGRWGDPSVAAGHRVRPRPMFVLRTALLTTVAAVALAMLALGLAAVVRVDLTALLGLGALVAGVAGLVTADALTQETTTNHPLPAARAAWFGAAVAAAVAVVVLAGVVVVHRDAVGLIVVAALLLVASAALAGWLGATTTNRHKAWTLAAREHLPATRFEAEPETAARFGLYTVVIWLLTLGVAVLVGFTAGWWWSLLAVLGGVAVMMLVLARMLFGPRPPTT